MFNVGPIVISYCREDINYVHKIRTRSSKTLNSFWYDDEIRRSDPSWRSVIDEAIKGCCAVFVICSPASRNSNAVSAEIELAQAYEKPIYPIWADGTVWAQSAPFSLITYNYTDLRGWGERTRTAIDKIIDEIINGWPRLFEANKHWTLPGFCNEVLCGINCGDIQLYFRPSKFDRYLVCLATSFARNSERLQ
jgi:hypothetical protein